MPSLNLDSKGMMGVLSTERNNLSVHFVQSLLGLKQRMGGAVNITFAHSGTIPDGRNLILDIAKQNNCDYAVMIDSDMTFPPDGLMYLFDSMARQNASIGVGLYFGTYPPYKSAPMAYINEGDTHRPVADWSNITEIDSCGMGFTVITKDLFDLRFRFETGKGEDYLFCKDAKAKGVKIILDPRVKLGHLRLFAIDEEFVKKHGM